MKDEFDIKMNLILLFLTLQIFEFQSGCKSFQEGCKNGPGGRVHPQKIHLCWQLHLARFNIYTQVYYVVKLQM